MESGICTFSAWFCANATFINETPGQVNRREMRENSEGETVALPPSCKMSAGMTEGCSSVGVSLPLSILSGSLLLFVSLLPTTQASSCVRPFSIQHGQVNVTETNRGSFPVGTVLKYSCDSGYTVEGPSVIVCTREGLWSSGPPHCLHNNYCFPPLEPKNGGYTCHPSPCHRLTHGTVVEYFCDEGYTLKGNYKYLTCQKGEWNGPMEISCVLSQGCVRPFSIQHGQVNVTETNRGSFPVGTVLQYSCDSGFTVDGPSIVVCTREGLWSSGPPRCLHNNLCSPPLEPQNGGYTCHPSTCHRLTDGTVVEYFCEEGYTLKGDYKYITCQNGDWNSPMQISCVFNPETHAAPSLGMNTLSIVATTASSVALVLLLMVVWVLLQPKLKAFHHGRREQGDSGQPVTIMVEGVQVTLPSYEEAVSGVGGAVLPRLLPQTQLESMEQVLSQTSTTHTQHTEISVVHQPSSSSPFSSSWSLDGAQGATAASSAFQCQNSDSSQQNSLLSLHDSEQNLADDIPLLKES
ncbi:sushi domain-containing protein 6 isoform X2 [Silurus meridionalis]|nr:sushi domain-containing protein 6 isoform X2 [Silurus meridionalis]